MKAIGRSPLSLTPVLFATVFCLAPLHMRAAPPVLTGVFGFTCDASGSEINNERWDTVPTSPVWNLWFSAGVPLGTPDGLVSPFINGPSNDQAAISVSLPLGTNHYTFFAAANDTLLADHAINLFFNGRILPSISAKAATWRTNTPVPAFTANASTNTYALDDSKTAGAGSLAFSDDDWTVTLTDYFWAHPTVFQIDRITRGLAGSTVPDGRGDFVGRLSLAVKRPDPRLSIVLVTTNVVIDWPSWAESYTLEATEHLSGSPNWAAVTNPPSTSGGRTYLLLPAEGHTQFYRLSTTLRSGFAVSNRR